MAVRKIKPIDWAKIQERISPALKPKFNAFKGKSDTIMANYMKAQEKKLAIDWSHYHKAVANKALVKDFEVKFNALKVPQPVDSKTEILDQNIVKDNERVALFIKESEESIADLLSELDRLNSLPPFEQMTEEDITYHFKSLRLNYEKYPFWPHRPSLDELLPRPDNVKIIMNN